MVYTLGSMSCSGDILICSGPAPGPFFIFDHGAGKGGLH